MSLPGPQLPACLESDHVRGLGSRRPAPLVAQRLIPRQLQERIDGIVGRVERRELEGAAQALSDRYRAGGADASRAARTAADVAGYLAVRAPATYAAVEDVLGRIRTARPE